LTSQCVFFAFTTPQSACIISTSSSSGVLMSSRFVIYLSIIIVFFQFDSVNAQSIEEELKECSVIEVSLIRLQCYDRITASPDVKNAKPSRERTNIFSRLANRDETVDDSETSEEVSTTENQSNTSPAKSDDNFGLIIRDDRDSISSKIVGTFEGWSGTTKFKLENGQVWQQNSFGVLRVKMNNPNIVIKRSILSDTYTLKIEGLNSSIRVKRIE